MRGRACLLALLCLSLSPLFRAQPVHANSTAEPKSASTPASTNSFRLPAAEPVPPLPIRPVAPTATFGLPQLSRSAGLIFSGRVTGIARQAPAGGLETVSITFHVEHVLRGATPGENRTITQWIGLWSSGQRYRIGDRMLLFLYPPSKLGLTSCVGWPLGRFSLDRMGRVVLSAQQRSAFRRDPVLGGKPRVSFRDFSRAVRQASAGEE